MEAPKSSTLPGTQPADSKLHFLDYWRIIRIRKTVILAVFLLVVMTTTAVTFILPETYRATARIEVGKDIPNIASIGYQMQGATAGFDPYFINTEFEKIRAQKVMDKVIEMLKLNETWAKKYSTDGRLSLKDTREILQKQIEVKQARSTSLIEINAYSDNKKEAAEIANAIAEVYQNTRQEARANLSEKGIDALKEELQVQTRKVEEAQKVVDTLGQELSISDVGDIYSLTSTLEPETVRNIERDRVRAESEHAAATTLLSSLKAMPRGDLRKAIPSAYPDPAMNELLAQLAQAEQKLVVSQQDLGKDHPDIEKLAALIVTLNKQVEARIDGVLLGLEGVVASKRGTADSLKNQVDEAKSLDAKNRELYRPYFAAKRDVETQIRIRDTIFMRILQETVDAKIPKGVMVEIVDIAQEANRPVSPNLYLNISLGVVVGLIMGLGLAFFIEYLDTSVKTIDDVERALQAPVLGVIPQNVGSLLDEGPDSPHAEAYRVLRTNMLFARKSQEGRTITVVSGGAGEGKSTTIFNLAIIFAQNGAKVLLVDSDLRRPSLHKLLNVSNSLGLTNFLLKQNKIEEVIQTTNIPTLHFLPSGKLPSSSLGILNSAQMREFIRQAREIYDFVFFDSPPIMGVSDASILASEVDMALLVIQYRKYPQVMTIRAKQMVEKVGGNLMGVVLNNINISQDSYYYYYSGYYYDYYSKHDDSTEPKAGGKSGSKGGETQKNGAAKSDDRAAADLKQKY